MTIYKIKGGYKVKSYVTGKLHRTATGKVKVYKTKSAAKKSAGRGERKKSIEKFTKKGEVEGYLENKNGSNSSTTSFKTSWICFYS